MFPRRHQGRVLPGLRLRPPRHAAAMSGMRGGTGGVISSTWQHMKRRLFNLLAAVSLVLCVAMGALWIRSVLVVDQVQTANRRYVFITSAHRVWFVSASAPYWAGVSYSASPRNVRFERLHPF